MNSKSWHLPFPVDAISFDCDSTLSKIEGIDQLAEENNCLAAVKHLTAEAMNTTGLNETLYTKRLSLVNPTLQQTQRLAQIYYDYLSQDAQSVINVFQSLGKSLYILSAGNQPTISLFAEKINIRPENTFSVALFFNDDGSYRDYDHSSPLIHTYGKNIVVDQIHKTHKKMIHIGDGINDVETRTHVSRFIGYGGHGFRQQTYDHSQFYIRCESMLPLLPLCLTAEEALLLDASSKTDYEQGLELLYSDVAIKD